jgi:excisionase family DNA binding protein
MATPAGNELLTPAQAAEYLKVHRNTLLRWRKAGTGPPAIQMGRQWRYRRSALDWWLAERETTQGESSEADLG